MTSKRYSNVPVSIFGDSRLGLRTLRVLGVLICHAGRKGVAWPTREVISQMTGVSVADVSRTTTRLAELGYLKKTRGRGKGAEYLLSDMCESDTSQGPYEVCESDTSLVREVCESDTSDVCESSTSDVCESSTSCDSTPILLKRQVKTPMKRRTGARPSPVLNEQEEQTEPTPTTDVQPAAETKPDASNSGKARTKKKKHPPCPHEGIIAVWGEELPDMPQPKRVVWLAGKGTRDGKRLLADTWQLGLVTPRENGNGTWYADTESGLAWWRLLFKKIARSPFLTGKTEASNGHRQFKATLRWVANRTNLLKILDDQYDEPRAGRNGASCRTADPGHQTTKETAR